MSGITTMTELMDEVFRLRQQLAQVTQERDSAEMRSVAHLKMYIEASNERSRTIESDRLYKFVANERDNFERQLASSQSRCQQLEEALNGMVERYTSLVNCGDCGNWNPETEECVIAARQALTPTERSPA